MCEAYAVRALTYGSDMALGSETIPTLEDAPATLIVF